MSAAPWVRARTLRVLVVDDSAVARQLMSGCLRQAAMDVFSVADPIFAIQRMKTWSPDVIVLDLEMPRMDGLTFLRMLRGEGGPPVVVCSGSVDVLFKSVARPPVARPAASSSPAWVRTAATSS